MTILSAITSLSPMSGSSKSRVSAGKGASSMGSNKIQCGSCDAGGYSYYYYYSNPVTYTTTYTYDYSIDGGASSGSSGSSSGSGSGSCGCN
ncbi:hypothetical protein DICPUDRAFT_152356 [Dictyostelium purpureum]|uniref:Uncharacterized protein n=1 Tax=Dictyostelium purpureum TaxID=5786 RepID=F0ZL54_DICPU|nr:uncharacterized protein DICPUDRAFT_152356 [Dictyostelium purpureum]EGC35333.1 hypothetical protein DICPUDRAFT_152356 [Dictyostelium purpureum]|eukprot:XP_003288140.1 hypothetical protein DICPUDRAFT_152356 [Dictyostelium purpureum]